MPVPPSSFSNSRVRCLSCDVSLCVIFRQAWQLLGDMSKEQAMGEFVKYLDSLCPLFKPYVQAHKAEKDDQERRR